MKEEDYQNGNDMTELEEFDALDFGGEREEETEKKMNYVEENLWEKLERVGKKISFAKDILALVRYMRDPIVSWHRKAIVVAALIYFISPIDAIPDITPLVGYLDDLGVITAVLKFLGHELIPYYDSSYRS
jgi:uncharacterized membrane protein YkvA (DUF1232 family)